MKLSFSTLGCLDFDWTDIYAMAKDFGFDGIEMRGLGNDIFSVRAQPFRADQIDKAAGISRGLVETDIARNGCQRTNIELRKLERRKQRNRIVDTGIHIDDNGFTNHCATSP